MQDHELIAWLGPAADELTPEQIETVSDIAQLVREQYPDPDEQPERDAALSAAVQHMLGETTPEETAATLTTTILAERTARAAAVGMAVAMARAGTPKSSAARAVGIDRMLLLEALGERQRRRRPA